jgi:hypothetical protein
MSTAITTLLSRARRRLGPGTRRGGTPVTGRPATARCRRGPTRGEPVPMTSPPSSGPGARPGRPWWRVAAGWRTWIGAGTVLALMLAGAPAVYAATGVTPSRHPAARHAKGSTATLNQDLSGTLPNLHYGQAVGDFTGVGHDQRAYFSDGQLKISEANKYGGALQRSTPTDLKATPNDGFCEYCGSRSETHVHVWQDDNYTSLGARYGLTSVKVASSASNIYMAGATWNDLPFGNVSDYQLHLYKLPHDGSCASAACAQKTLNLPSRWVCNCGLFGWPDRYVVVTSLAVGVVGGRTLIAVGLSDTGLAIYDENLNLVDQITDMAVPQGEPGNPNGYGAQTPVISLGFSPPSGPGQGGVLAAGVASPWLTLYTWRLNPDGTELSMSRAGGGFPEPAVLSAGVARVNGQLVSVFGRSDGVVFLLNPDTGVEVTRFNAGAAVTGLTAVTSWDDTADNQYLVLGEGGSGQVVKYVAGKLAAIPIGVGGATTGTADQVDLWYPGYGAGRLQVANGTAGDVSVSMASRPDPSYGCWLNASVTGGPPAFPADQTPVAAGQTSPQYFAGALTAGPDGSCASAQDKGEWSSYVVITPAGDPADEHLVKLRVDPSAGPAGRVRIEDQAGGYLTATLSPVSPVGGSWGSWELRLTGGATPAAVTAPAVTGYRLTSAEGPNYVPPTTPVPDDPARPVYRFDVSGAQWKGIGAAGQVTARIPAMTAQGSTDGVHWQDLGKLMPSTAPSRNGDTVTLGPASFFWQDAPAATPLTEVRVVSGGLVSTVVHLASLPSPPVNGGDGAVPLSGINVTPAGPGGNAAPRADGVDQASLNVAFTSPGVIANDDLRYQLVFYRDQATKSLITGLYTPGDYSGYVAVGPWRGAYPNDGAGLAGRRAGAPAHVRSYLVTTSAGQQTLIAVMNDSGLAFDDSGSGTDGAVVSSGIAVAASASGLTPAGTAATGVQVTGCGAGPCPLAAPTPTAPALYQAGRGAGGPVTGLQLTTEAVTGVASLPLQVGAGTHTLASAPLVVTSGDRAVLQDASGFWPTDTIDTALVTSGELVPAPSVPVGK